MSKKPSNTKVGAGAAPIKDASNRSWLAPVSDTEPCGPDLEYDHDFVVLLASVAPKQDVQYGEFVGTPDPLNWSEIERDCQRLMKRTKDIRVAVLYTRCRTRLGGAAGLAEGTALLAAWLHAFAENIHPHFTVDGDREATLEMRMNALQALADPEGLLADVREIVLTKSTLARLQVRDVERAFAHPRAGDALSPDSVAQQLQDLRIHQSAMMTSFDEAGAYLTDIERWCGNHLGTCADFGALTRLLQLLSASTPQTEFGSEPNQPISADDEAGVAEARALPPPGSGETGEDTCKPAASHTSMPPADRQAALKQIRAARQWFETNEPSSPIPVLLRRAEHFVGKRYADVVRAISAELLAEWDQSASGDM
ncbi:ImpA family type VI secretion system protein [Burkholderia ubonensis]|uniref:type VI secretion system protein TssA n=1 Tax=Burkholderia ubonensis TaxID=101571 RepID=UPI00075DE62B|nr:type VI secretion system ImpA family N-terminal domain-containing protein [Burkholderia ubonensis]KWB82956.1 type VI secretion protein ImpA [Burkholderia ubonensis]